MSEYITIDEVESKLSLVVRKPQEGKTFICISDITADKTRNIHIVLTMNTLSAGMQFFGRMEEIVGSKRLLYLIARNRLLVIVCMPRVLLMPMCLLISILILKLLFVVLMRRGSEIAFLSYLI